VRHRTVNGLGRGEKFLLKKQWQVGLRRKVREGGVERKKWILETGLKSRSQVAEDVLGDLRGSMANRLGKGAQKFTWEEREKKRSRYSKGSALATCRPENRVGGISQKDKVWGFSVALRLPPPR